MAARTDKFVQELKGAAVRVTSDTRDNYTPGWKYNHWELKVSPPPVHAADPVDSRINPLCIYDQHAYP